MSEDNRAWYYTDEQKRWLRESPHAENVRTLHEMHLHTPADSGARGLFIAALREAEQHPDFPPPDSEEDD